MRGGEIMENFAEKLKSARKKIGLTQKTMAESWSIPRRTLEDWERGINEPPEYVQRLVIDRLLLEVDKNKA
jgi:DNA-binding transcriptional regulator YiaG